MPRPKQILRSCPICTAQVCLTSRGNFVPHSRRVVVDFQYSTVACETSGKPKDYEDTFEARRAREASDARLVVEKLEAQIKSTRTQLEGLEQRLEKARKREEELK